MARLDVAALFGRRVCAEEQRQIDGLWIAKVESVRVIGCRRCPLYVDGPFGTDCALCMTWEGCDLRKRPLLFFVEAQDA
ncbi:MAG: hypothetical protein ACYTBJ_21745 [Planctomycetota bacterium]|jgi:hypothetical protein